MKQPTSEEIIASARSLFGDEVDQAVIDKYIEAVNSIKMEEVALQAIRIQSPSQCRSVYEYLRVDYNMKLEKLKRLEGTSLMPLRSVRISNDSILSRTQDLINKIKTVNTRIEKIENGFQPHQAALVATINQELEELYDPAAQVKPL